MGEYSAMSHDFIMETIMSQKAKVLAALKAGEQLTAKQIAARFSAKNPHEVVRQIREEGFAVYGNKRTNSKGETKTFYRLGTPSRKMVAAAYAIGVF
jgi:predicted ArsR family transcriptional regulator